jgi:hypothetical protein
MSFVLTRYNNLFLCNSDILGSEVAKDLFVLNQVLHLVVTQLVTKMWNSTLHF